MGDKAPLSVYIRDLVSVGVSAPLVWLFMSLSLPQTGGSGRSFY